MKDRQNKQSEGQILRDRQKDRQGASERQRYRQDTQVVKETERDADRQRGGVKQCDKFLV